MRCLIIVHTAVQTSHLCTSETTSRWSHIGCFSKLLRKTFVGSLHKYNIKVYDALQRPCCHTTVLHHSIMLPSLSHDIPHALYFVARQSYCVSVLLLSCNRYRQQRMELGRPHMAITKETRKYTCTHKGLYA